jgi:hypothetical protein
MVVLHEAYMLSYEGKDVSVHGLHQQNYVTDFYENWYWSSTLKPVKGN